jgi:hypothetical protein
MDKQRMTQLFRHLLRNILNETDEELGQPFGDIADFMADQCVLLKDRAQAESWDDHRWDSELMDARDEVKRFAAMNGSHPDHRHILGAVQGAMAVGARTFI